MTSDGPTVSIVIPTFRRPAFLERAIACVLDQTFAAWELVVVDDNGRGTPDQQATEAFMGRYAEEPRIAYMAHSSNMGGSAARNTGVRSTSGEFVAFLDDDDEWLPEKLERQMASFETAGERVGLLYTGAKVVEAGGGAAGAGRTYLEVPSARGDVFVRLLGHNVVGTTSSILCRRSALTQAGLFDDTLGASQDYDLYLRLARICEFEYVPDPLVIRHKHAQARITKDLDTKIAASARILEKYEEAFARESVARSKYLFTHGRLQVWAGYRRDAVTTFLRSFRADPRRPGRLIHAALTAVDPSVYELVRRVTRPPRLFVRRLLGGRRESASQ